MEKIKVEREITLGGKVMYKHIDNGEYRKDLLKKAMAGEITQEEMRAKARKAKYLISENEFLKNQDKYEVASIANK